MKSLKQLSLAVLLSVFVLGTTATYAQECNKKHSNCIENIIPDLTDGQKAEIKKLKTEHRKDVQQIKNQMEIKRAELKALQTAENPDIKAINKKIEERSALRTELEKKSAAHKQSVRKLLNDEQKAVYDKKITHRGHGHKCSGAAHKCSGQKSGHKCSGQKEGKKCCSQKAGQKCSGQKAEQKCSGQKAAHKCSGQKAAPCKK